MTYFTIGKLSRALGIRTDTIRYYERNGLLPPPARSSAGYRTYGDADLERVRFIRKGQQLGFTLREIGSLLDLRASDTATTADVLAITESKINEATTRIDDLTRIKTALSALSAQCSIDIPIADCPILARLASIPRGSPPGDGDPHAARAVKASI